MKWTEKDLCKYAMMREAGFSKEEIRREFGERTNRGGKSKPSEKKNIRSKNMKEYGKRVQIDPAEFWAMVDAGKTRTEIAKHYGVSVQTVCNRITKGRPGAKPTAKNDSERECKFEEIINSVDAGAKKEKNDMDTNERIMDTFLASGRPEAHECDTEDRVPVDAASTYAEMFAVAASGIMKSAEFAGITVLRASIIAEGGTLSAKVEGCDRLGRPSTLRLTVDELDG